MKIFEEVTGGPDGEIKEISNTNYDSKYNRNKSKDTKNNKYFYNLDDNKNTRSTYNINYNRNTNDTKNNKSYINTAKYNNKNNEIKIIENNSSMYSPSYIINYLSQFPIIIYNENKIIIKAGFWDGRIELNNISSDSKEKRRSI